MAVKDVLLMGADGLRQKSVPVDISKIKSDEVQVLIKDLRDTAKLAPQEDGYITVGLSAPQIGKQVRIFAVIANVEKRQNPVFQVYINPEVSIDSDEMIESIESCLSTPGLCGKVKRHNKVRVTYYDERGAKKKEKYDGEKAIFVQHELDHLDGILWIDRVGDIKTVSYC